MEHVVFFSEPSGDSSFRRVSDLEEAVRLVETLRNERGITDVAVHALTPVPVSFRTYYRVEVAASLPESGLESEASEEIPSIDDGTEGVAPIEDLAVEVPGGGSIEAPALHLLPPPAAEGEQVDAADGDREDVEAAAVAEVAVESVVESPAESSVESDVEFSEGERSEPAESEDGDSFEAFSLELVLREDESGASAEFASGEFGSGEFGSGEFGSGEEFASFGSLEPQVPQVRPEPEVERSLGYFAR